MPSPEPLCPDRVIEELWNFTKRGDVCLPCPDCHGHGWAIDYPTSMRLFEQALRTMTWDAWMG